jgi:hypothetical protein
MVDDLVKSQNWDGKVKSSDARRAKAEERGVLTRYAATTKVKHNAADGLFTRPSMVGNIKIITGPRV